MALVLIRPANRLFIGGRGRNGSPSPSPSRAPTLAAVETRPGQSSRPVRRRGQRKMAEAGVAAVGGAGGGVGVGAGEEDVPDIRFLYMADKMDVKKRSKKWLDGNVNSPLKEVISVDEKEQLLITYFGSYNLSDADLFIRYTATGDLRRQPPDIVERNDRACDLCTALGRKRRLAKFLMILYQAMSQGSKQLKKIQVPPRYREPGQLKGNIKSLKEGCNTLFAQIVELCDGVTQDNGIPIGIPEVFNEELEVPKIKK